MDTKKLINEVLSSGLTQIQLARELGCSQPYVSDLSTGKKGVRLSFQIGTRLYDLHKKRVINGQTD